MKHKIKIGVLVGLILGIAGPVAAQEPGLYEDEFTERPVKMPVPTAVDGKARVVKTQTARKKRRCVRCGGKGKTISVTRQLCDRCGGSGVLTTEIELKDTVNGDYWRQSSYKTTRKAFNRQSCPHCNRSGRVTVKKELECSLCKGTGELP